MTQHTHNVDPAEVDKFRTLAARWWDPDSELKTLHDINPLRIEYIDTRARLAGKRVLDVGCGGGILAEAMAQHGAVVTGIDMAEDALNVAKLHLLESGTKVDYLLGTAEQFAAAHPAAFDVVTCMELLEHVPDPASVVRACATLVKPGGQVFLSTLNRTPKAYLLAVIGAEYVLNMLPRGTHDYARFIRPSEIEAWARHAGLELRDLTGMTYNPLTRRYRLGRDIDVNYLTQLKRGRE
ncbi:MAG: bifunctional 2-polyprenyl-6-hydroxyphenol methylase/3-demethylubiquinol 3-O-methyltransferase UbiG [Gammaproteobacteria bacterium]|nr:bifunctional 2-polyprenyl-6-hydroxyphenol methylase/3-demethylubiquinol 3-O-methyltransferase UbiG [Gammaproteobacteria bacterium]